MTKTREQNVIGKLTELRENFGKLGKLSDREFIVVTYYHFVRMGMAFEHLANDEQEKILELHEMYIGDSI